MISIGISIHWLAANKDDENRQAIKRYFISSSIIEKIKIQSIAIYYYTKNRLKPI